jgi:hypothetical protein
MIRLQPIIDRPRPFAINLDYTRFLRGSGQVSIVDWEDGGTPARRDSGPMEAMCKNLTLRLQRTGMKWDVDYAPGLRSLIAIREGRQWDHSWETRRVARRQNPRPNETDA